MTLGFILLLGGVAIAALLIWDLEQEWDETYRPDMWDWDDDEDL